MKSQSPLMHMPDDNFFTEFAGRNIGISDNQLIKISIAAPSMTGSRLKNAQGWERQR